MQIYFRLKSVFFFRPKYLEKWKILLYYDNINPGQPLSHLYGQVLA